MTSFWDESWSRIDASRLDQYIETFDFGTDGLIEELLARKVSTVCDAGCGCGIYTYKLISHGFLVSGFDVSSHAVQAAKKLLERVSATADLKTASILKTGYPGNHFDAVISRDVIDHMNRKDGILAVNELYRITKPGGVVLITLDHLDSEYETEPHRVNDDGDYVFSAGKWRGMVFHPYHDQEISKIIPVGAAFRIENTADGILIKLYKPEDDLKQYSKTLAGCTWDVL